MTGSRRGIARGLAAGAACAALIVGGAACTGDRDPEPGPSEPAPAASQTPSPSGGSSDGGGEQETDPPGSPFAQDQLDAAAQRFVAALQVLDDGDWEAACAMVLDPTTQLAPVGSRLMDCTDGVGSALKGVDALEPGAFDALEPSMVEAEDTGEDLVRLSLLDEEIDIAMAPGADGAWYLAIPF